MCGELCTSEEHSGMQPGLAAERLLSGLHSPLSSSTAPPQARVKPGQASRLPRPRVPGGFLRAQLKRSLLVMSTTAMRRFSPKIATK